MNIALPVAQRDLGFSAGDRQRAVTGYAPALGSLLLLAARIAQGAFAAMLAPTALALVSVTFAGNGTDRGRAFGIFGAGAGRRELRALGPALIPPAPR